MNTRLRPSRRSTFLACSLLLLLAVPVVLTWRAWRQEQVNQALIAAIKRNDPPAVQAALKQGADPNAQDGAETSFWTFLHDHVTHQPPSSTAEYGSNTLWTALKVDQIEANAPGYKPTDPRILTVLVEHGARFDHLARPTRYAVKWKLRPPHEVFYCVVTPETTRAGITSHGEQDWNVEGTQEALAQLYAAIQATQAQNGGATK